MLRPQIMFHRSLQTWSYFVILAYRLYDPGAPPVTCSLLLPCTFLCLTVLMLCVFPLSSVFPPLSAPHPVVLSPQSLYPSDSRQCVLHPPTWHSAQGPQGVCVCVCACVCRCAALPCTLWTRAALYMLVFLTVLISCLWFNKKKEKRKQLACACRLSVCLCLSVSFPCLLVFRFFWVFFFAFGTLVALF